MINIHCIYSRDSWYVLDNARSWNSSALLTYCWSIHRFFIRHPSNNRPHCTAWAWWSHYAPDKRWCLSIHHDKYWWLWLPREESTHWRSRKETYLFAGAKNNRTRFSKRNQNDDSFVCYILQIVQNKFERLGGEVVEWLVQQDHFSMWNHFNCNSNFSTYKIFSYRIRMRCSSWSWWIYSFWISNNFNSFNKWSKRVRICSWSLFPFLSFLL